MHTLGNRFEKLIAEAERQPFEGWNFSYGKDRIVEEPLPWNYLAKVRERLSGVSALLNLGTGGGEVFAQLEPFPQRTFATEEYAPNAPIAARRLHPLGAQVVRYEAPMENNAQLGNPRPNRPTLPFRDGVFDLVIDRHETYLSVEVLRILRPGGRLLTQQCGGTNYLELNDLLGMPRPQYEPWGLESAQSQLLRAGFERIEGLEQIHTTSFHDVGAVVYFLRTVPWQIPDFTASKHLKSSRRIHWQIESSEPAEDTCSSHSG